MLSDVPVTVVLPLVTAMLPTDCINPFTVLLAKICVPVAMVDQLMAIPVPLV